MFFTFVAHAADSWDLSAIYPDVAAWRSELEATRPRVEALAACEGHVAERLLPCVRERFEVEKTLSRLYSFAHLGADADTRDAEAQARTREVEMLWTRFGVVSAGFGPELVRMPAVDLADPALAPYDHWIREQRRRAAHTLPTAQEELLAGTGAVLASAAHTHELMIGAELPWPELQLGSGRTRLGPAAFTLARSSASREERRQVYDAFFGALAAWEGTLGSTLDASVQGDWMMARARRYDSSLDAALDAQGIPRGVYDTLVAETTRHLPTLHRYLRLRAKILGVSDLAYHDLYAPLSAHQASWSLEEAQELTRAAMRPLGRDYLRALDAGFAGRWMDALPREGKRPGAYMEPGAVGVHPYLLLNYQGDYASVSTFAHEWGHAMHSVLSGKKQVYPETEYPISTAEVASTLAESLLTREALARARTDEEQLFVLAAALESLRTTWFRQAAFAEFELRIHERVERGEPLTGEALSAIYLDILRRTHGHGQGVVRIEARDGVEWAYVGHFYRPFYVWQYASSLAAASALAADVYTETPGAQGRVLALLEAGGSAPPVELLRAAGVDLESPAPYDAMARRMEAMMDHVERILARR